VYEPSKFRFLLLLAPLYSRIGKEDVERSIRRGELIGYISKNPGASFSTIRRDLKMGNGQLSGHLARLEKAQYIRSRSIGIKKCFFPWSFDLSKHPAEPGHQLQTKIMSILKKNPGLNQNDITQLLGIPRKTAGYHLSSLVVSEWIRIEKKGRENLYFPNGEGITPKHSLGIEKELVKPINESDEVSIQGEESKTNEEQSSIDEDTDT